MMMHSDIMWIKNDNMLSLVSALFYDQHFQFIFSAGWEVEKETGEVKYVCGYKTSRYPHQPTPQSPTPAISFSAVTLCLCVCSCTRVYFLLALCVHMILCACVCVGVCVVARKCAHSLVCVCFSCFVWKCLLILYVLFTCLYAIDLCMGICALYVFLWFVKCFESPKVLCKFPIIISVFVFLLVMH